VMAITLALKLCCSPNGPGKVVIPCSSRKKGVVDKILERNDGTPDTPRFPVLQNQSLVKRRDAGLPCR
jgi:hypothetical protein